MSPDASWEENVNVPNRHVDVSQCFLYKFAYGMHFPGSEDEVLRFVLLENPPHSLDVITS